MYTLYSMPGTCSTAIHTLLNQLERPVKIIPFDQVNNYHQIAPTKQVPALQDGDTILTEGAAIVLYLLEKHGINLDDWGDKQQFYYWLMFCYATLHPAYSKLFASMTKMPDSDARNDFYQNMAERISELWQIVDRQLANNDYLVGDKLSVMDYLIAIYANWGNVFPELSFKLGDNVIQHVEKIAQLPEFKLAYQREGAIHSIPLNS
ncbi:glutathione S-transferase [Catenovulum agarivorans DS-2]|uniref:Glutathione S-transferase n=1 Tax=Catenovulum agarivorans DS-2 TaxID=1328313 RepID=W7QFS8_9ALTE|nr:glutathione S-transferase family protein [Catenovulum agarivorans]EWH11774.1 glutathione S-transferase [Catenovulum agarivorans DS-2]